MPLLYLDNYLTLFHRERTSFLYAARLAMGLSVSLGSAQAPPSHSQQKSPVGPGTCQKGVVGLEKRKETRCHAATLSLVRSPLETLPGAGVQNMVKNWGKVLKSCQECIKSPSFLFICYAPGPVLAIVDTKMMVTSLKASPCLDHPRAKIF